MAFFRSEHMSLCKLCMREENAFECLVALAQQGKMQFNEDDRKTPMLKLRYLPEIARLHEIRKHVDRIEKAMEDMQIETDISPLEEDPPKRTDLWSLEYAINNMRRQYENLNTIYNDMLITSSRLLEKNCVLEIVTTFMDDAHHTFTKMQGSQTVLTGPHENTHSSEEVRLGFVAGSIPMTKLVAFRTTLWRITQNKFYFRHTDIPGLLMDKQNVGEKVQKCAFVTFVLGKLLHQKVKKLCDGFGISLYDCPESSSERSALLNKTRSDLTDANRVLQEAMENRTNLLHASNYECRVIKRKAGEMITIYAQLNKLQDKVYGINMQNENYYCCEVWIPKEDVAEVREVLASAASRAASGDEMLLHPPVLTEITYNRNKKVPPTFFRLNKFTRGFQNLIDAYGIGAYRELNPAPYTIISFPFLFAVMFGDVGHGLILLFFAGYITWDEDRLIEKSKKSRIKNEIWNIIFAGRYIILLMAIFSIYVGFLYNDIFSKSLNIFGSSWSVNYTYGDVRDNKHLQLDPAHKEFYHGTPYVMGLDPVWEVAPENAIQMVNSLKMKLAIILGITQMYFGLTLLAINLLSSREYWMFWLTCVPQMVFLLLFLYLVFLIFYKWQCFGGLKQELRYTSECAPSILLSFIGMVLMKPSLQCGYWMFDIESVVEPVLLLVAFCSIPVLLCGRPLFLSCKRKKIKDTDRSKRDPEAPKGVSFLPDRQQIETKPKTGFTFRSSLHHLADDITRRHSDVEEEEEEADSFEEWVHQGIHTIECVLGSVSHTASYLRLWALSLAHSQLSNVLWEMVLSKPLISKSVLSPLFVYIAFSFWAVLTIAILVIMEGLSAFLHTLRLHWVEFQSKFYAGSGTMFMPFKFVEEDI